MSTIEKMLEGDGVGPQGPSALVSLLLQNDVNLHNLFQNTLDLLFSRFSSQEIMKPSQQWLMTREKLDDSNHQSLPSIDSMIRESH